MGIRAVKKNFVSDIPLPSDASLQKIATVLEKQQKEKDRSVKYTPVKQILAMLGRGAIISAAILAPKSVSNITPLLRNTHDWDDWKHYNISHLQKTLRRLAKLKQVEIRHENGQNVVKLTKNGKRTVLKYSLETLQIDKPHTWDGNWRIVMYDIPKANTTRDSFRKTLTRLGFIRMQESVYLYPYPCFDQIEYVRQYYFLDITVQYILARSIENDETYRTYFDL